MSVREEREERRVEGNSVRGESTASFLRSIAVHGMTNAMMPCIYRKQCTIEESTASFLRSISVHGTHTSH